MLDKLLLRLLDNGSIGHRTLVEAIEAAMEEVAAEATKWAEDELAEANRKVQEQRERRYEFRQYFIEADGNPQKVEALVQRFFSLRDGWGTPWGDEVPCWEDIQRNLEDVRKAAHQTIK